MSQIHTIETIRARFYFIAKVVLFFFFFKSVDTLTRSIYYVFCFEAPRAKWLHAVSRVGRVAFRDCTIRDGGTLHRCERRWTESVRWTANNVRETSRRERADLSRYLDCVARLRLVLADILLRRERQICRSSKIWCLRTKRTRGARELSIFFFFSSIQVRLSSRTINLFLARKEIR